MITRLLAACTMCLLANAVAAAQTADTIYQGGRIITVNNDQPAAEAVAVKDGKILAVGKAADVANWPLASGKGSIKIRDMKLLELIKEDVVFGHARQRCRRRRVREVI